MHVFDLRPHPEIFFSGQLSLAVWLLILLALAFDFLNGLHDAANSVATVVSTRVLSPRTAVIWAAFFNFVAFLVFPTKVATTIQRDVIDPAIVTNEVIAATLLAACGWNILTWFLGLPTSSSHALIGGMVGAALAKTGSFASLREEGLSLIILFIFLAPLIGALFGTAIAVAVAWICHRMTPARVDRIFRRGQLLSAALFSLGHGGNDAQKTMGIIFVLLIAYNNANPRTHWHNRFELTDQSFHVLSSDLSAEELARLVPLKDRPYSSPAEFLDALQSHLSEGQLEQHRTKLLDAADRAHVPTEVVLACHLAMGLGTMTGGWRIVKTMGQRIIRLRPVDGFCAETAAAAVLGLTTFIKGLPISTTHTISGAIVGVGSLRRLSAVRWGVAGRLVWAWILTIPGSALMAALFWGLFAGLAGSR
jgi:PiT family inorganic phosphate transporter